MFDLTGTQTYYLPYSRQPFITLLQLHGFYDNVIMYGIVPETSELKEYCRFTIIEKTNCKELCTTSTGDTNIFFDH